MLLTVQCPRCKHDMRYQPALRARCEVAGKKKRCVYCGMTFNVHPHLMDTRVVCEGPRAEPNTALF